MIDIHTVWFGFDRRASDNERWLLLKGIIAISNGPVDGEEVQNTYLNECPTSDSRLSRNVEGVKGRFAPGGMEVSLRGNEAREPSALWASLGVCQEEDVLC